MTGARGALWPAAMVAAAAAIAAGAVVVGYQTTPMLPLLAALGLAALAVAYAKPMVGLYLALGAIPLEVFSLSVGFGGLSPAETMFAIVGAAWLIRCVVAGESPVTASPLGKPFALLLAAVLTGLFVAVHPSDVIKNAVMWTCYVLIFQMVLAQAGVREVRTALFVLALAGAAVGLVAVAGSGSGPQLVDGGAAATGRAVGSFSDPNILASFLALTIPGALALAVRGPVGWRPFALGAFLAAFAGLGLSLSRGGLFAAAGAIGLMLLWQPVRRVAIAAAAVLIVLTVVNANPLGNLQQVDTVLQRVSTVQGTGSDQVDQRSLLWETSPQIILDNLPFGVGAKQFAFIAPQYQLVDPSTGETFEHAHNIVLTVAAELGVLGVAALAWWLAAIVPLLWRSCRRSSGLERGLSFAVAAALLSVGLQGLVDYAIRSNVVFAAVCMLSGFAVVLARAARAGEADAEVSPATPPRRTRLAHAGG